MSSYFKPTKYEKDQKTEKRFKNRNLYFWGNSTVFPTLPFVVAIGLLVSQIIIPIYFFTGQKTIPKPVEKSVLGYSSGYREYTFSELQPKETLHEQSANVPDYFYLTIPKLNIHSALVETNSTNLSPDNSIGHYLGSALPGETGTSYLYGHSVLPIFYNPRNYRTVFSKLGDLETGDEIIISYNDKNYLYKVEDSKVLATKDVKPLENKKPAYLNEKSLVLMTCWPAGTKAKRFEVVAVLSD